MTAEIFKSSYMKKEFEYFYQVLIPNLNTCGNCGVVKCGAINLLYRAHCAERKDAKAVLNTKVLLIFLTNIATKNNGLIFAIFFMIFLIYPG